MPPQNLNKLRHKHPEVPCAMFLMWREMTSAHEIGNVGMATGSAVSGCNPHGALFTGCLRTTLLGGCDTAFV